ncbi:MAG: type II secretion system secretin GspD [Desulfobacteraceae bacterium]|nr:type II secretion system secretin GspD [Desulfobacteraceae bacterium]
MSSNKLWVLPLLAMLIINFFSPLPPAVAQAQPAESKVAGKFISIDFNNVDINVFIKFISELTGKNFVVDKRVKGNVTIISPSKISVDEAYGVFESVLSIHGFTTVEAGQVTKILPSPEARSKSVDTRISKGAESPMDRIVTRIIPLKFAEANELKKLFTPLISKGSVILAYSATNTLIITDFLSNIERLLTIINSVDVMGIGKRISVIPVENADAVKLVKNLSTIFMARIKATKSKQSPEMMVKFVADERTNSIVVLASDIETERVKQLVALLDKKIPRGDEKIRVYYLEHASAETLAKVLQEMPEKMGAQSQKGKKTTPVLSEKVKITADKATNSLIIMAEKEDYPVLEEVIQKLDIPRSMVYIECLIMEVKVNAGLDLGTQWKVGESFDNDQGAFLGGFGGEGYGNFPSVDVTKKQLNLPKGFSAGVMGRSINIGGVEFPTIGAVIQAYETDKNTHILSTPQVLTTDNEEATLTIGKNVPYQTRSAAESGTDTYSSYEYKDVGITLKITPQISKDRLVRLTVFQEITALDSANTSANDRPTTLKRKIETTLIVEDGNTVVIGGLIDETLSQMEYKVPCLGDIPGLSYLFKNISNGNDKTNLYVFLTPRVIKNPLEAANLYKVKRDEIDEVRQGDVKLYNGTEEKK